MSRLIIVSFGILGLIFFEMSGGADFDPEATRLSRVEAPELIEEEKLETVLAAPSQPEPESVTRVAVNLTSVNDVLPSKDTSVSETNTVSKPPIEDITEPTEEKPAVVFAGLLGNDTNFPILERDINIPQPQDVRVPTDLAVTDIIDIRQVSGNRVNVRSGPGTEYSVVEHLTRGQKVEVLQDLGNGWVQFRLIGEDTAGWIADFLLSEG